ncbi:MAG: integrin alpha, partial [Pseudomonadota bacterium]
MNRTSTKPAVLALHIGLALGVTQTASAQLFPSAIALSDLDGSNGIAINGDVIRTGTAVDGAGDVNGDGIDDLIIGAPTGGSTPGESYVVFGSDGGLASPFPLSLINGLNGFAMIGYGDLAFTGGSVSGAGDINGDGIDDLIVGAPFIFGNRGHSYVVFGTESGFPNPLLLSSLDGQNGITVIGDSGSQSGGTVSNAGDVNGDGVDDVLIAAATANPNGLESGRSYVIFGPVDDLPNPFQLSAINGLNGFVLEGQAQYDYAGVSVSAAGDINGDGIDDLIISAPGADVNGLDSGNSYVVFGSDAGLPSPFNFAILNGINGFVVHGETANDRSGISVSGAGDVNGDG